MKDKKLKTMDKIEDLERVKPNVDIKENKDGYRLRAEIPGVLKEDVKVMAKEDSLEIEAAAKFLNKDDLKYSEFNSMLYYRKFKLGRDIDCNSIKAHLEDGILTLNLPKSEIAKPKTIVVE